MRLWNVAQQKLMSLVQAHDGFVRGLSFGHEPSTFFTVGDDRLVKQWRSEAVDGSDLKAPVNTMVSKTMLTGVSHHRTRPFLATSGEACHLWEHSRAQPVKTFQWGVDSLQSVKFNAVEENVLGSPRFLDFSSSS